MCKERYFTSANIPGIFLFCSKCICRLPSIYTGCDFCLRFVYLLFPWHSIHSYFKTALINPSKSTLLLMWLFVFNNFLQQFWVQSKIELMVPRARVYPPIPILAHAQTPTLSHQEVHELVTIIMLLKVYCYGNIIT